jgi:hypothetical protein
MPAVVSNRPRFPGPLNSKRLAARAQDKTGQPYALSFFCRANGRSERSVTGVTPSISNDRVQSRREKVHAFQVAPEGLMRIKRRESLIATKANVTKAELHPKRNPGPTMRTQAEPTKGAGK